MSDKTDIPFEKGGEPIRVKFLRQVVMDLSAELAESHANTLILILSLQTTDLDPNQQLIIALAREKLTRSQNAFLKAFGDWEEPGKN
jgi:hypothetical protein